MTEPVLTLQEAADRLKVHYMTAYRWVRRGDLPALKVGGRLRVRARDLEAFMAGRSVDVAMPSEQAGRTDWETHAARLHERLRQGAASEASAVVRKVIADGATVGDVYVDLITPALHRIGNDWAAGTISVADEHRASEIARAIVARCGESFRRRGPARGTVVTLTPPDEQHGLACAMLADFLRGGGFDVHHLGPNVPLHDLELFLGVVPSDAVCVSISRADLAPSALGDLVRVVRRAGVQPVLGGQAMTAESARRHGAAHADDPRRLSDLVAGLVR